MRGKILGLASLACVLGGSVLLAPASSQARYPQCEIPPYGRCAEYAIEYCSDDGQVYRWECFSGTWYFNPEPV